MSTLKYWLFLLAMVGAAYSMSLLYRKTPAPVGANHVAVDRLDALKHVDLTNSPFQLTAQDGQPFDSATLNGKIWVASFFFTNCPAVCWRLNQALAAVQANKPGSEVHYVSVTCDPDNDTPAALQKYADHFKADPARWKFLTGDLADLKAVGKTFQVTLDKGLHSDRVFVVDRQGAIRGIFQLTEEKDVERFKKRLTRLLEESSPKTVETSQGA